MVAMILVFLKIVPLKNRTLDSIVDRSVRWHHAKMRIVTYLLLKQMILKTLLASSIVFSLSVVIQTLLLGHKITPVTGKRTLLFGATIGAAWTLTRWRYFHGAQLIENLGLPRWLCAVLGGIFTTCLITISLTSLESPKNVLATTNSIEWQINSTPGRIMRADLRTEEQLDLFEEIHWSITHTRATHPSTGLLLIIPWILFALLTSFGDRTDLWRPIFLTGISLALIELWLKANA